MRPLSEEEHEALIAKDEAIDQDPILDFFQFDHLSSGEMKELSREFAILAGRMLKTPRTAERTAGLRKLLEAKDCFVRNIKPKK